MKNIATVFVGLVFVLMGFSFLFDIFHVFNIASLLLKLWPILLIILGINQITKGKLFWGIILVTAGLLFIINNYGFVSFNIFAMFGPVLIILLGLSIILKAFGSTNYSNKSTSEKSGAKNATSDYINEVNVLSEKKIKITSLSGNNSSVVTILGGTKLDLTEADFGKESVTIEVVTVLGETVLMVSEDIEVKMDTVQILGGVEDQRKSAKTTVSKGLLIVKGVAVLGAITIKS